MSFILMQPGNDEASCKVTEKLLKNGDCNFDLKFSGPWLCAILSDMRKCTEVEFHYHSFAGGIAILRWAIVKKLYL